MRSKRDYILGVKGTIFQELKGLYFWSLRDYILGVKGTIFKKLKRIYILGVKGKLYLRS